MLLCPSQSAHRQRAPSVTPMHTVSTHGCEAIVKTDDQITSHENLPQNQKSMTPWSMRREQASFWLLNTFPFCSGEQNAPNCRRAKRKSSSRARSGRVNTGTSTGFHAGGGAMRSTLAGAATLGALAFAGSAAGAWPAEAGRGAAAVGAMP